MWRVSCRSGYPPTSLIAKDVMNFCFFHNHLWQTEILGLHQHVLSYEVLGSNSELPTCYGILYWLHSQSRDRFLNFVFSLGFMCGRCTLALLLIFNSALLFMFFSPFSSFSSFHLLSSLVPLFFLPESSPPLQNLLECWYLCYTFFHLWKDWHHF